MKWLLMLLALWGVGVMAARQAVTLQELVRFQHSPPTLRPQATHYTPQAIEDRLAHGYTEFGVPQGILPSMKPSSAGHYYETFNPMLPTLKVASDEEAREFRRNGMRVNLLVEREMQRDIDSAS